MKSFLITIAVIVLCCLAFFLYQNQLKTKYDKATEWNKSTDLVFTKDEPKAISLMQEAKNTWWHYHDENFDSKVSHEELQGLKLAGFNQSIIGIKELKAYITPDYSYFDSSQNKQALITTTMKNVSFVIGNGKHVYYTEDWLFYFPDINSLNEKSYIKVYENTKDGIHFHMYCIERPKAYKELEAKGITFTKKTNQ